MNCSGASYRLSLSCGKYIRFTSPDIRRVGTADSRATFLYVRLDGVQRCGEWGEIEIGIDDNRLTKWQDVKNVSALFHNCSFDDTCFWPRGLRSKGRHRHLMEGAIFFASHSLPHPQEIGKGNIACPRSLFTAALF
jgi:hypothetical protein